MKRYYTMNKYYDHILYYEDKPWEYSSLWNIMRIEKMKGVVILVRSESHIDFRTHFVIMTRTTWLPPPSAFCVIFRLLTKSIVFQKFFEQVFRITKANCIFEELSNLCFIILLISFIPFLLWITTENRTKLKKLYIRTTKSGGAQHHKHTNFTWISSATPVMLVIFWTERELCIISDCRNSFSNKLKTYEQAKNLFNPADTQSSSEESL